MSTRRRRPPDAAVRQALAALVSAHQADLRSCDADVHLYRNLLALLPFAVPRPRPRRTAPTQRVDLWPRPRSSPIESPTQPIPAQRRPHPSEVMRRARR